MSDAELVPRLRSDPAALEAFYRGNVDRVTRFAARRCTSPADVADAVSATFMTAIDASASFDPCRGTARAWLLGIAAHELSRLHRRAGRERRGGGGRAGAPRARGGGRAPPGAAGAGRGRRPRAAAARGAA